MNKPLSPTTRNRHRNRPRWLPLSVLAGSVIAAGIGFAACTGDLGEGATHAQGQGGNAQGGNAQGGANFNIPTKDVCAGNEGQLLCDGNTELKCSAEGSLAGSKDCLDKTCVSGEGCVLCVAGQFSCQGDKVASCDTSTSPSTWSLGATCDLGANKVCDAGKGACVDIQPTGSATATGTYYQFAHYEAGNSVFLGGASIDSFEDTIYVNRDGSHLDVYSLELLDSDGDGILEPNQHPDNPDHTGPIEERKLTLVKTYDVPELGYTTAGEIYATADKVFFLDAGRRDVFQFDLATEVVSKVVDASNSNITISHLGYDDVLGLWYGSSEQARRVYEFHAATKSWVLRFEYPDMAGSHMDGIEVVTDTATNTPYVYVSDMTSDFLGQYRYDRTLGWVQENVFEYNGTGGYVEGMGFGALNHFWAGSGRTLYEVGGGDLTKYVEPQDNVPK